MESPDNQVAKVSIGSATERAQVKKSVSPVAVPYFISWSCKKMRRASTAVEASVGIVQTASFCSVISHFALKGGQLGW